VETIRETTSYFLVSGWGGPADKSGPMKKALLVQNDTIHSRLTKCSERKDVSDHFKAPGMRDSGFMFCVPYTHMQSGPSLLRLLARDGDGTLYEFYRNDINIAATLVAGGDEPRITRARVP
jgi:hypothetical protein